MPGLSCFLVLFGMLPCMLLAAPSGLYPIQPLEKEYFVRSWTKEQGLPDRRVNAILKTHHGYVWVATRGGVARFDGNTFLSFTSATVPPMTSGNCLALAEDTDHAIWVATDSELLQWNGTEFVLRMPWLGPKQS